MESHFPRFAEYLKNKKKMAVNSVNAYLRDLREYAAFLEEKRTGAPTDATEADVAAYLLKLKHENRAAATVNRKLASVRAFYKFMLTQRIMSTNPAAEIKTPKIARKEIEYLTIGEVETLLDQPGKSVKGIRDAAILEALYATGLRVSELIEMNVSDVNLRMGFVTCNGEHGKARIIPLGRPARAALESYIYEGRSKLLRGKSDSEQALFLNYYGERITRQALWKILKNYATQAGVGKKITPQILRNSFAVHMVQNGADLKSLQELLGHEDLAATQIYLTVSKNRIKDVYDSTHPRA
ncbi:MAG: tyrosine recombinase XerD [Clostridiales Family XIII bacterium]|jgi:integrase/recombinase XerD|nr:tyrosine recombinase XerD [Clostridiales Family XIII bacterium]